MADVKTLGGPLQAYNKISTEGMTQEAINDMQGVPYASTCGSLMYAMVGTRPNIVYVVGVVSRFMANSTKAHCNEVKSIVRYLKGTKSTCFYRLLWKRAIKDEGFL